MNREQALAAITPAEAREAADLWMSRLAGVQSYVLRPRVGEFAVVQSVTTTPQGDQAWSLLYVFSVGANLSRGPKWVVSADVDIGTADQVFERLAVRLVP